MSTIDELVATAGRTVEAFSPLPSAVPSRGVAVVACMDARLDLFGLLGLAAGEAHLLRNAGGTVTDDTLRSLVISQRRLGTRATMLVHHTDCGMATFTDEDFLAELEAATGERPAWLPGAFSAPEADVRASLARLRSCPWLVSRVARGFVFDVGTGRLTEVDGGPG